jgi:hypothetical protein
MVKAKNNHNNKLLEAIGIVWFMIGVILANAGILIWLSGNLANMLVGFGMMQAFEAFVYLVIVTDALPDD